MNLNDKGHLTREALSRAVVAEEDLDAGERDHLAACPACREELRLISEGLAALGRTARKTAPAPLRRIVLPEETIEVRSWFPGWQGALGYALAASLVLVAFFWGYGSWQAGKWNPVDIAQEMEKDAVLLAEVSSLVEDSLSDGYSRISPENEAASIDDDTIDFMAPIEDDQDLKQG